MSKYFLNSTQSIYVNSVKLKKKQTEIRLTVNTFFFIIILYFYIV